MSIFDMTKFWNIVEISTGGGGTNQKLLLYLTHLWCTWP